MSKERLSFLLPVVFTVGPDVNQRGANAAAGTGVGSSGGTGAADDENDHQRTDKGDALTKYAMLLAESSEGQRSPRDKLDAIVRGIVEGETRVLVSSMTMEDIFAGRE